MRLAVPLALAVTFLAAGCGVRNSTPYTAKATAPCLRKHGFTGVTTDPGKVGFIAGFADLGGLRGLSPQGNGLTIAFVASADPKVTGSEEAAFKAHAPKRLRPHITDIMSANRNAVLVWTTTPSSEDLSTATGCLSS